MKTTITLLLLLWAVSGLSQGAGLRATNGVGYGTHTFQKVIGTNLTATTGGITAGGAADPGAGNIEATNRVLIGGGLSLSYRAMQWPSNSLSVWPTSPLTPGGSALVSSNGINWLIEDRDFNGSFESTNRISGPFVEKTNSFATNALFVFQPGIAALPGGPTEAPSYSNGWYGVEQWQPQNRGSSIAMPDRNGIFWQTAAGIYDWNDHGGDAANRNELQVLGGHSMALACYNAGSDGGFQMGGSGAYHDHFWMQYDTATGNSNGYSKRLEFRTQSGNSAVIAYSAIQAEATSLTATSNRLNFFAILPDRATHQGGFAPLSIDGAGVYTRVPITGNGSGITNYPVTYNLSMQNGSTLFGTWTKAGESGLGLVDVAYSTTNANFSIISWSLPYGRGFTNFNARMTFEGNSGISANTYIPITITTRCESDAGSTSTVQTNDFIILQATTLTNKTMRVEFVNDTQPRSILFYFVWQSGYTNTSQIPAYFGRMQVTEVPY